MDTSEGVVSELEQAFSISKQERNQIKHDIDEIVKSAIEQIRQNQSKKNNKQSDISVQKSDSASGHSTSDASSHKSKSDQHKERSDEFSKRLAETQYAMRHFAQSLGTEISNLARFQNELEHLSAQTDSKETTLYLQFCSEVCDNYQKFKYKLQEHQKAKAKHSKGQERPKLQQQKSFKGNVPSQLNMGTNQPQKQSSMTTILAPQVYSDGQHHSNFYPKK